MILERKFVPTDNNDYERLAAVSGRLRAVLEAFAGGTLPPEYGPEQLAAYASSLIAVQRDDGSISGYTQPQELDAEVRADLHRFVTWAAAALLSRLKTELPDAASAVENLDSALERILRSPEAANFAFPESGPAEPVQQIEAVLVLSQGYIPRLLAQNPSQAPVLSEALRALAGNFRGRMASGDTTLPGNIAYAPLFEQALAQLAPLENA